MQVTRVGENEVNADIESIKHLKARPTSCVSDAALVGYLSIIGELNTMANIQFFI